MSSVIAVACSCTGGEKAATTTEELATSVVASADTYVRQGSANQNQGALPELRLQDSGNNRALVRIDQAALVAATSPTSTATLKLTISDNGNNWGTSGRQIAIYRMTHDWSELGATWNCSVDTDTSNSSANCSGATAWEMDKPTHPELHPWQATATATAMITSGQSGTVTFDVTADVAAFRSGAAANYGWIIKKVDEGAAGRVELASRETATPPTLVVDTPCTCPDPDECHAATTCDSMGACTYPAASDGTSCNSGAGSCHAGTCEANPTCTYTVDPAVQYQVAAIYGTQNALTADVNGDGNTDIVAPDYGGAISTLLGNGDGTFASFVSSPLPDYGNAGALADFDGDGRLDMATSTYTGSTVHISLGNGDGTFAAVSTTITFPGYTTHLLARDVNADGLPDIEVIAAGQVAVLTMRPDRTFDAPSYYLGGPGHDPAMLAVADLDHDGDADIVVSNRATSTVDVLLGNGDGTFSAGATYATGGYPEHVVVGDVNGDGHVDVLTGNYVSNSLGVLLGNGDGTLQPSVGYPVPLSNSGDYSNSVALGDLDNDGDLDAVLGAYDNTTNVGSVVIMSNNGSGVFAATQIQGGGAGTTDVAVADLDHDGTLDVVSVEHTPRKIGVHLGSASAACPPPITAARYWRLELASVDTSQGASAVLTEVEMQWGSATHVLSGATLSSPDFWGGPGFASLIDGSLDQSLGCYGCDYAYTGSGARLDIDLMTPQAVESILISQGGFRETSGLEWTIASLNIYSSNDGVTYTLVRPFTGISRSDWTAETLETFSLYP